VVEASWDVKAHPQKPDFFFRWNGRIHLNWRGRQFSRLLAADVCASGVVMLDTSCSEVVWRVLATHSIRQFSLHFPFRASPCAISFQLESTQQRVPEKADKNQSKQPVSSTQIRTGDRHDSQLIPDLTSRASMTLEHNTSVLWQFFFFFFFFFFL
jgi:hypothetical protein